MLYSNLADAFIEVEVVEEDRLNKLAAFQLMMIKHAMKCEQFGKW